MEKDHNQSTQHDKFALGKVDNLRDIIDNIKPDGDHGIYAADGKSGDEILKQLAGKCDLFHRS